MLQDATIRLLILCSTGMLFFSIFVILFSLRMSATDQSYVYFVIMGLIVCTLCVVIIRRLWKSRDNKTVITSEGIAFYTGKKQMKRFISWNEVELVCYERSLYYGWLMRYRIWLQKPNASVKASADELKKTRSDYAIQINPGQDERVRKIAPHEWGSRGRRFDSCHSDHEKTASVSHFGDRCGFLHICISNNSETTEK